MWAELKVCSLFWSIKGVTCVDYFFIDNFFFSEIKRLWFLNSVSVIHLRKSNLLPFKAFFKQFEGFAKSPKQRQIVSACSDYIFKVWGVWKCKNFQHQISPAFLLVCLLSLKPRYVSVYVCIHFCMSQCEFMCTSVYTAKSVFWLDKEVTSTLWPVSSVHTSHTPSGSRDSCSVWSRAAPRLIYFLPGTTAVLLEDTVSGALL